MNTELKVGLASSFSAFVGGTIAWHYNHAWWSLIIGLLLGALAGYLSYEWRVVGNTTKRILQTEIHLEPKWRLIQISSLAGVAFSGMAMWIAFAVGKASNAPDTMLMTFICGPVSFLFGFVLSWPLTDDTTDIKEAASLALFLNAVVLPFTVIFGSCWAIYKCIVSVACWIPKVFRWTWKITGKIFIAIHCEERVQAAFYGAIGLAVGHYASHSFLGVLVGALAGFVLGWGSYRLISARFLKPTPA